MMCSPAKLALILGWVTLAQAVLPGDWPTMEPAAYARLEATAAANYAVEGHYVPYEQRASAKPSPPPPPTPPSPLEIKYSALLNKTCEAVVSHIPVLPTADADNFMKAYAAFNLSNSEADVIKYASVLLARPDVQAFTGRADSFKAGGLDADLVLCTVLTTATPKLLANFSEQGAASEALVDVLLGNAMLMRDMLVAGGAPAPMGSSTGAHYGRAMMIYTEITKASAVLSANPLAMTQTDAVWDDRSQASKAVLYRLAIGTAVTFSVPDVPYRFTQSVTPPWGPAADPAMSKFIDPVARYMDYECAYLGGLLDPAFEVLTALEMGHAVSTDATSEDLAWVRDTMLNYDPSLIAAEGLNGWRYSRAVKDDVSYGDPMCPTHPGLCDGHYTQIPAMDGVCGYRAFFGRFTRNAHGIPTWGFAQSGHGAMTTWSPAGWLVQLGAGWPFGWSGSRSGLDFHLEMLARELRAPFQTVLRGTWASSARGDVSAGQTWGHGVGGLWASLMLYSKKQIVAGAVFKNGTSSIPVRPVGPPSVVSRIATLIAEWPKPAAVGKQTTGADGTITVPAAAFSASLTKGSVTVMNSADQGDQLMHHGGDLFKPNASSLGYEVVAGAAGTYYLTANHTTWHVDQDLMLAVNGKKVDNVPVYFTIGYWNETQSVEVDLVKGSNTLVFTRYSTTQTTFKAFKLYTKKPVIRAPPGNYTPKAITPPPASSKFILEGPDTSCVKQGIDEVPAQYCGEACAIYKFKYGGARSRPTPPGCFVMMDGPYKGNCNYNSNASAVCENPPCTLYNATVQNICVRS